MLRNISMVEIKDFAISEYGQILEQQQLLFEKVIADKKNKIEGKEYILIGEHKPVITLGRRAHRNNLLVTPEQLEKSEIKLFNIGRGGDITYHNPGQIILYPIINLEKHRLGIKDYVNLLEESVIRVLAPYGIRGERIEGATGVWIGKGSEKERKICAIGIRCSSFCTMHGLALNVNNDLSGFNLINPCGFQDKGVTSMAREIPSNLNKKIDIREVKKELLLTFMSLVFPFEESFHFAE